MRLKSIDVAGFRGFASRRKFDLSADATVIIGVNGLGKTSLLDAVLWGLCGQVARIGTDEKLLSMYSETGEARVSVELTNENSEDISVTRTSDANSQSLQLSIGGEDFKSASATSRLLEMLWPDAASANDGESALTSALVRSVYLQQDRVRDFLEAASDQERFNVVTELVGVGRLTELQLQLERERNSWTRAITQRTKEEAPLVQRVAELQKQLQKLKQSSEVDEDPTLPSWNEWWQAARELRVTIAIELPSATSVEASSVLNNAIQQLQSLVTQNGSRLDTAAQLRELLANEPTKPPPSIEELRIQNEQAKLAVQKIRDTLAAARKEAAANRKRQVEAQELHEQQRALAQIAIKLLGEHCPVCSQSYDIERTKARLEQLAAQEASGEPSENQPSEVIADLAKAEAEAVTVATDTKTKLDAAEAALAVHRKWEGDRDRSLEAIGIQANESSSLSLE